MADWQRRVHALVGLADEAIQKADQATSREEKAKYLDRTDQLLHLATEEVESRRLQRELRGNPNRLK
jgi:hypothetical protein